jgi:KDO2-lipid IV(A) lauroyltransferase
VRRFLSALGDLLGWLAGSVLRIRRRQVEAAMTIAAIPNPSSAARGMYRALGRSLVDFLSAGAAPQDVRLQDTIDADAVAALDRALARGPVVLFASHTGNWELAAAAAAGLLAERGRALYVVAKAMRARRLDAFLTRLRRSLGLQLVAPRGAFRVARRALASGDAVAMPIDQVPDASRHGLAVDFLGQTALVDRAPATLAFRARATVLVVAGEYAEGQHRVRLLDVIEPPAPAAPRVWIDETTRRATSKLDRFVRARPEAWLWLHRRWRFSPARF